MQNLRTKTIIMALIAFIVSAVFYACTLDASNAGTEVKTETQKIGVLLVNHGSRSETWRQALLDLETNVKDRILANNQIAGIKTAYMEYTEPSIATRMKEFDNEGFTDVIIVPIFLTVSPHTFDDIPTIIGQKEDPQSKEMLKIEKIERYTPKSRTYLTPNLDFTDILKQNVLRRVKALSTNPAEEGIALIGYGDETYDKEWGALFDEVAEYVKDELGITAHSYGWCGHIAHYDPQRTTDAVNAVLKSKKRAIVIPVLVAHDETFQIKIIGGGIEKVGNYNETVVYKPDAILPDANIEQWIIDITAEYLQKIQKTNSGGDHV